MQSGEVRRRRIRTVGIDGACNGARVRAVVVHELAEEDVASVIRELLVRLNGLVTDTRARYLAALGEERIAQIDQVVGIATGDR